MKNTIQQITRLGAVLLLAHGFSAAQVSKTPAPSATKQVESKKITRAEEEQEQEMRREQLKALRMSTLNRALDSIKKMDEPALRISARNEILKYLTLDTPLAEEDKALAANLAADALADFSAHADEIMPALGESLFSNLAVWIRKYQPSLNEKLEVLEKTKMKGKDPQNIRALMALPGGDVPAAQRLTQSLEEEKDIPVLILYLNELIAANSQQVSPLLAKIVDVAAQGRLSFATLLSVSDLYLQPQTPLILKQRFLVTVVARTQPFNLAQEPGSQSAYYLLTNLLPAIKELTPELYGQAVNQRIAIYASFNKGQVANEERDKRLSESSSPVEDLLAEAEETKSKSQRNELLAQAAQLALERHSFLLCLDAVGRLDLDLPGISPDFERNWNDQFLRDFVKAVLVEKKPDLAEKGVEHISSPYAKVEALALVLQYSSKAGDSAAVQRLLAQATKTASTATDFVDRARAFLLLTATLGPADSSEKIPLLESAIKALNSVSMPDRGDDLRAYQRFAWRLNGAEYQVTRRFQDLANSSNEKALILVEKIDRSESRAFALLGILQGIRDLSLAKRG